MKLAENRSGRSHTHGRRQSDVAEWRLPWAQLAFFTVAKDGRWFELYSADDDLLVQIKLSANTAGARGLKGAVYDALIAHGVGTCAETNARARLGRRLGSLGLAACVVMAIALFAFVAVSAASRTIAGVIAAGIVGFLGMWLFRLTSVFASARRRVLDLFRSPSQR